MVFSRENNRNEEEVVVVKNIEAVLGESAPGIDFEKDNLPVPSNTAARRIGHDVISLLKTNFRLYLNDTAVAVIFPNLC